MSALVIKNLPEALHSRLKARAAKNHRSLTKEAIALLEAAVQTPTSDKTSPNEAFEALLAAGDKMRAEGVDFVAWAAKSRDVWR